jgi:uncharacterized protein
MGDRDDRMRAGRSAVRAALAAFLFCLAIVRPATAADPVLVSIGTGSKTGVYYVAGGAICTLVDDRRWETGVRCLAEPSDGSIANLRDIRSGRRTFGIVQSDWLDAAVHGTGIFAEAGPDRELRTVLGLFREAFTVIVGPDAGIHGFDDLRGKRVSLGPAGSGGRATMGVLMESLGWTEADFSYVSDLAMSDSVRALCAGEIDAAVLIVGHPNLTVEEMASGCGATLIAPDAAVLGAFTAAHPDYTPYQIPAETYRGQPSAVTSFAVTAALVTSARTPPAVVATVARAVLDDFERFRAAHPAFAALEAADVLATPLAAPRHEGLSRGSGTAP